MKYLEIPELGLLASILSDSSQSVRVTTRMEAYSCKSVASERKLIKSLDQEFRSDHLLIEREPSDSTINLLSSSPDHLSHHHHHHHTLQSAFGRLDRKDSRKIFWLLITTLNLAYPDHNFSSVKVEDFHAESSLEVLSKISEALELVRSGNCHNLASTLGALSTSPECHDQINDQTHRLRTSSFINSTTKLSSTTTTTTTTTTNPLIIHPLIKQVLDPVIDLSNCQVYSYSPDSDSDPHAVISDDDEEEEIQSVSSSIYRSSDNPSSTSCSQSSTTNQLTVHQNNPRPGQSSCGGDLNLDDRDHTMWEIEGIEPASLDIDPGNDSNSSTNTDLKPTRNRSAGKKSPSLFSKHRSGKLDGPSSSSPPLSPSLSSSGLSNYEEDSAGGLLWSSHYFFYNPKMKRILFISIWGRKSMNRASSFQTDSSWITHQTHDQVDCLLNPHPQYIPLDHLDQQSAPFDLPPDSHHPLKQQQSQQKKKQTFRSSSKPLSTEIQSPDARSRAAAAFKRAIDPPFDTPGSSILAPSQPRKKNKSIASSSTRSTML